MMVKVVYKNTDRKITWINDESEFTPKTIQTKNKQSKPGVLPIKVERKERWVLKNTACTDR